MTQRVVNLPLLPKFLSCASFVFNGLAGIRAQTTDCRRFICIHVTCKDLYLQFPALSFVLRSQSDCQRSSLGAVKGLTRTVGRRWKDKFRRRQVRSQAKPTSFMDSANGQWKSRKIIGRWNESNQHARSGVSRDCPNSGVAAPKWVRMNRTPFPFYW